MEIATTTALKEQKRRTILRYIYQNRSTSRHAIGHDLPISLPTISQNLNDLLDAGLIERAGFLDSTGGRKAQVYSFNATSRIAIGVEILATGATLCAYDLYGTCLDAMTDETPYADDDRYFENLAQAVTSFIDKQDVSNDQVLGIAFAVQGIVSPDGTHITLGKILGNTGLRLNRLSERIAYPCRLVHDAHASATAELWLNNAIDNAVCLYLSAHVGGAVILDGHIKEGGNLRNGTCEHMVLDIDGPVCYCGQRGCMEVYARGDALTEDGNVTSLQQFFDSLHAGNPAAQARFDEYLAHLAHAIKNIRTVLNNDIVLGGDIAALFSDDDIAQLYDRTKRIGSFCDDEFDIIRSACAPRQHILGAALTHIEPFLDEHIGPR